MRVFLIGFMGSGKTHWGKIWAEEKGLSFYDLDGLIEQEENLTVTKIFEKKGEAYFRKSEAATLRKTIAFDDCIISCGGGTPCFDDNMNWMNEHGYTIYLKASPVVLLENILKEIEKRPLLAKINRGELLFFIEKKLKERADFYDLAQLEVDVAILNKEFIRTIIPPKN